MSTQAFLELNLDEVSITNLALLQAQVESTIRFRRMTECFKVIHNLKSEGKPVPYKAKFFEELIAREINGAKRHVLIDEYIASLEDILQLF